ncbi:MAG: hypothetical protein QM733_23835 [Ilumatobacteraceae bacterium]
MTAATVAVAAVATVELQELVGQDRRDARVAGELPGLLVRRGDGEAVDPVRVVERLGAGIDALVGEDVVVARRQRRGLCVGSRRAELPEAERVDECPTLHQDDVAADAARLDRLRCRHHGAVRRRLAGGPHRARRARSSHGQGDTHGHHEQLLHRHLAPSTSTSPR